VGRRPREAPQHDGARDEREERQQRDRWALGRRRDRGRGRRRCERGVRKALERARDLRARTIASRRAAAEPDRTAQKLSRGKTGAGGVLCDAPPAFASTFGVREVDAPRSR
jgi:hypothetical protein